MKRSAAIQKIVQSLSDQIVVHATGMISRESFAVRDREENFYMIGSMGLNSAIGLGLAINRPDRMVVILDGDGSVLMNLGILPSIAELAPKNLIHIVLDNESYASTGGQRSISDRVALEEVAKAVGYPYVNRVDSVAGLAVELKELWKKPRPSFLLIKVEPGNEPDTPRVTHEAPEIVRRVRQALGSRG